MSIPRKLLINGLQSCSDAEAASDLIRKFVAATCINLNKEITALLSEISIMMFEEGILWARKHNCPKEKPHYGTSAGDDEAT